MVANGGSGTEITLKGDYEGAIWADSTDIPKIDGEDTRAYGINIQQDYWAFENLDVTQATTAAVFLKANSGADGTILRNCLMHDSPIALRQDFNNDALYEDCELYLGSTYGYYVEGYAGSDAIFRRCKIYGNDYGMYLHQIGLHNHFCRKHIISPLKTLFSHA
jgi:hypothetical protein